MRHPASRRAAYKLARARRRVHHMASSFLFLVYGVRLQSSNPDSEQEPPSTSPTSFRILPFQSRTLSL